MSHIRIWKKNPANFWGYSWGCFSQLWQKYMTWSYRVKTPYFLLKNTQHFSVIMNLCKRAPHLPFHTAIPQVGPKFKWTKVLNRSQPNAPLNQTFLEKFFHFENRLTKIANTRAHTNAPHGQEWNAIFKFSILKHNSKKKKSLHARKVFTWTTPPPFPHPNLHPPHHNGCSFHTHLEVTIQLQSWWGEYLVTFWLKRRFDVYTLMVPGWNLLGGIKKSSPDMNVVMLKKWRA